MYSNTANFGKICVLCIRKAPQSAVGECTARTSCHQGALSPSEALESCTAHESCHPLMDLALRRGCIDAHLQHCAGTDGPAPAQGLLPEQPHRGIVFQLPGPCAGVPAPSATPIPTTCQYLPLAVPPPLLFKLNQTRPVGLRWLLPKKRNGARQRIKVWKRQLGFRYKQRLAFEGLRHALDSLHKLAAPDEQPKPKRAASSLHRKRLPNARPGT